MQHFACSLSFVWKGSFSSFAAWYDLSRHRLHSLIKVSFCPQGRCLLTTVDSTEEQDILPHLEGKLNASLCYHLGDWDIGFKEKMFAKACGTNSCHLLRCPVDNMNNMGNDWLLIKVLSRPGHSTTQWWKRAAEEKGLGLPSNALLMTDCSPVVTETGLVSKGQETMVTIIRDRLSLYFH